MKYEGLRMERGYQYAFSSGGTAMYDRHGRERKARTMVSVLADYFEAPLDTMALLNVGGSAGIIDNYLAQHFGSVISIDIDEPAIAHAKKTYQADNLTFQIGDALHLPFSDNTFDVAICSQIYEHVPDPEQMLREIFRVLRPGGICYFAASNRFMWYEPHYYLPLLSAIPRPLAHLYIRLAGKAPYYYERHYSYWTLKKWVHRFTIHDYTCKIIQESQKYHADYMIRPGSLKARLASFISTYAYWLTPGYIWLLEKPHPTA
jgi:ubiquinone/menaquinone biosynthesis C-methylase UbiE